MRRIMALCLLASSVALAAAHASDAEMEALIALDKEWGAARGAAAAEVFGRIVADGVIAVDGTGLSTKAEMAAAAEADTSTDAYVAGDYQVRFLNETTAVMTHSAGAPDPHWSLHVFEKHDGSWQIIATMSAPVEAAE